MRIQLPLKFALLILSSLLGAWGADLSAQFSTPTIDGNITAGEYGSHLDGSNQQTSGTTVWYMAWDANNLYLAFSGSNAAEAGVMYLDFDPIRPVNGGSDADGSVQGFYTYDRNHMMQPFRADFVLYFKNSYHEYRYADAAGYWAAPTSNSLTSAFTATTGEIAIPWNALTNGNGRPPTFNWFGYKVYDYGPGSNGVYHPVPTANPSCTCNQDPSRLSPTRYYNVLNTNSGSSTLPFSTISFNYYEDNSAPGTGGFFLSGGSYYDFSINDNSTVNTDNDPANHVYDNQGPANRVLVEGNISISHDLYIGMGSALLPGDNTGPDVLATLTFTGADGSVYNYGRIDPNPEAAGPGDFNRRRIDFVFDGITTLQPSDLFKDRYRLSNITINSGAQLLGPATDSTSIELQWGTLDNNGLLDFGGNTGGFVNLGTRGDLPQQNDVFFTNSVGTGTWLLHDILIGRNSSSLRPVSGGGVVELQVLADFENYDEFVGEDAGGRIDVIMAGDGIQYFRGNTTETNGSQTSFFNLEIDNNNGAGNNNGNADVHFLSFGGGTIDYEILGQLTLNSGDLVTRDRSSNLVHNLTLRAGASLDLSGAGSDNGGAPSSFVDGPLRWETASASPQSLTFPIGKTIALFGQSMGDYRRLILDVDPDAATSTIFTAETFTVDRSTFYNWPSPVPETIAYISDRRYWNVSQSAGAGLDSARITLDYDQLDYGDNVTAASGLRILKDDGAGNWVNVSPLGPGGTANLTGNITSHYFNSFSDFVLADITGTMFPVELLDFSAEWKRNGVHLDWVTASEMNTSHFELERSLDGQDFIQVGTVLAAQNSQQNRLYDFWDATANPNTPTYFYRLKIIDLDGSVSFSPVRIVTRNGTQHLSSHLWPNPGQGEFYVLPQAFDPDLPLEIHVFDLSGQLLHSGHYPQTGQRIPLSLPELANGVYLLEVRQGAQADHHRLMIRK